LASSVAYYRNSPNQNYSVTVSKPLPFTEARVRRAIAAARKEGLAINAVSVHPDGTVTIHQGIAAPTEQAHNTVASLSEWEDIQV
jgi:hypothetical protein